MRKTNKKGFTIVELVIVISIIAVLAAILIPTFAGVIGDAKDAAAKADAKNVLSTYMTAHAEDDVTDFDFIYVADDDRCIVIKDGVAEDNLYKKAAALAAVADDGNDATTDTAALAATPVEGTSKLYTYTVTNAPVAP